MSSNPPRPPGAQPLIQATRRPGEFYIPSLGRTIRMSEIHPLVLRVKAERTSFTSFAPLSHTPGRIPTGEDWVINRIAVEPTKKYITALEAARQGIEREDLGSVVVRLNARRTEFPLLPLMDSFVAHEALKSAIGLEALARTLRPLREALAETSGEGVERAAVAIDQVILALAAGTSTVGEFPSPLVANDTDDLRLEPSGGDPVWVQIFGIRKTSIGR